MKEVNLTVEKRGETGKGPNRRTRMDGDIPAVVYGPDIDPISIKINYRKLYKLMHGTPLSTIINLDIEGDDSPARKVLIRELQKNPVSGELLHIDFHNISMDRPITITIPIIVTGIPIGVKDFGGIVQHVRRDIEISCLPAKIPADIEIDISELGVGDSIHVSDLDLKDVELLTDLEQTVVTVVAPTVIKEEVAAEEEVEGEEGEGEEGAEGAEAKEGEAKEGEAKPEGDDKKKGGDKDKK